MPDHSAWSHYRPITVDDTNVDATLTDFPLLVQFDADADLAKARADGYDVRFTLDDGVTALEYERLTWSGGGGSSVTADFWVSVPSIDSAIGATIRIYYGNATASDGEDAADVWADAEAVLHLDDTSGPMGDATGNEHTAAIEQGTQQADGVIYKGRESTADGDRLLIDDSAAMEGLDEVTVDCWVRFNTLTGFYQYPVIWAKTDYSTFGLRLNGDTNYLQCNVGSSAVTHPTTIAADTWYHVACSYQRNQGTGLRLYVNGVETTASAPDVATPSSVHAYSLLARYWDSRGMDGRIEEWRFWPTAGPCGDVAAYAKFTHANVTAVDNELTIGAEVACAVGPPYRVVAGQNFCTGPTEGSTFNTGIVAGEVDGRAN